MAIKYVEINNLLYEINEKGERVLVCSTESVRRAYLRFSNETNRHVDIWWRDFRGTRHHYICLEPACYYDITTYISHPWEFTDVATKERYVVSNTPIFRAPPEIGGMMYRTNWNITISVRTLRHTALLKLAERITTPSSLQALGLPRILEAELQELIMKLHPQPAERVQDELPDD